MRRPFPRAPDHDSPDAQMQSGSPAGDEANAFAHPPARLWRNYAFVHKPNVRQVADCDTHPVEDAGMTKLEIKIVQLEREAAASEAAYRDMRRAYAVDTYERAARRGEVLANLLRDAADARQKANELRAQLPPGNPLYRAASWLQARHRSQFAA